MITVRAGFLPLLDASIVIAAAELGFAAKENINLLLMRETSWANVRDRVSVGQLDVAHMLAPLPIAQNLGLSPLSVKMIAPFALGLGGNAVTVSNALWQAMLKQGANELGDAKANGQALRQVLLNRSPITLAVVHNHSAHSFELRYWLAASGINPTKDVNITIVSPGLMADALASAAIEGFCVGEPWNSVAVAAGHGKVVTTKSAIWRSSPEKVLGMTQKWAEQNSETLNGLLRALHKSAVWCAAPKNREALAEILAKPSYLNLNQKILMRGLEGRLIDNTSHQDFLQFYESSANFPWQSHALWFYSQMARWQQVALTPENTLIAKASYRPDIYRSALRGTAVDLPDANSKVEGGLSGPISDGFFDDVEFDPDGLENYVKQSAFFGAVHNN